MTCTATTRATAASQAAAAAQDGAQQAAAAVGADVVTLASFALAVLVLLGLVFAKVLRPGALGKGGLRKVDAHPWWVWMLCGLMVFYCGQVGGILVSTVPQLTGPGPATPGADAPPRFQAVLQVAVYTASLTSAAVLLRLLKSSAPDAGLTVTGKSVWLGVLWLLMALPVVNTVGELAVMAQQLATGKDITTHLAHPVLKQLDSSPHDPWTWIIAGIAILLAPIQEEILFRGFLQTALVRLLGRPWWSILIASAVFASLHISKDVPWYAVAAVFVLGLAMGLAFERTKSLGTSIVMHIGFNALNVAIAIWGR
jgi:membrane protease YdiL (CAAX protease family)